MTNPSAHSQRPLKKASILALVAITAGLGLVTPAVAPARQTRRANTATKRRAANKPCSAKRGTKRSSTRGCTKVDVVEHPRRTAKTRSPKAPKNAPAEANPSEITPPDITFGTSPESSTPPAESTPHHKAGSLPAESGEVLNDPIDPRFLTEVPFGTTSFWIQPWRAYLDTWPASRLLDAAGINFGVSPTDAESTAQLLQDSGFKLARREIPWDALSYEDPTKLRTEANISAILTALHNHGLRPLILLNANSTGPGPSKMVKLDTTEAAPAGAQTVTLTASSAAAVVPGKTGFNGLSFGGSPDILITSVGAGGVATLSRPLPEALAAGVHGGTTLLYAPFGTPELANGEPNPVFQETLAGWLSYVATVCKEAASIVGPEGYDLEVWDELSFGSQFLNAENYYVPAEAKVKAERTKEVIKAVLDATVAYVRNPANGIPPGVGTTDGFASETPFPSGKDAPLGLTALSKHPYAGVKVFPAEYPEGLRPLDALGAPDTISNQSFAPLFIPSYQSLFPEYYLTATSTETSIRDLAPFTTGIYGYPHGREVGPEGGPPVQKWITEYNLSPAGVTPVGPDEVTPETASSAQPTPADKAHFEAKVALRSLVANVSKGMAREYFYKAGPGGLDMIGEEFFSALDAQPATYPGDQLGGETMNAFRNMFAQFQGPGPGGAPRQLQLLSIAQDGNHAQFNGDETAAHPPLYDRDVLAVFPFQSSPTRFVIPVYVMTRDLLTLYEPNAPSTDVDRFDLPNETFRITLGDLPETSEPPSVSAYDPLRNEATPARLVSREGSQAVFEFAATDYPRLLTIEYNEH